MSNCNNLNAKVYRALTCFYLALNMYVAFYAQWS